VFVYKPYVRFLLCPIVTVSVSHCVRLLLCPFLTVSDCHCVRLQLLYVRSLLCPINTVSVSYCVQLPLCPINIVSDCYCVRFLLCPIRLVSDLFCAQLGRSSLFIFIYFSTDSLALGYVSIVCSVSADILPSKYTTDLFCFANLLSCFVCILCYISFSSLSIALCMLVLFPFCCHSIQQNFKMSVFDRLGYLSTFDKLPCILSNLYSDKQNKLSENKNYINSFDSAV